MLKLEKRMTKRKNEQSATGHPDRLATAPTEADQNLLVRCHNCYSHWIAGRLSRAEALSILLRLRRTLVALVVLCLSSGYLAATNSQTAPVPSVLVAAAGPDQDIVTAAYSWFGDHAANMSPATFSSFIRVALILIFQTIVCAALFANNRKTMPKGALLTTQWAAALLVLLVMVQVPLEKVYFQPALKTLLLPISVFALAVLPWKLSWLLCPLEGRRRILAASIYSLILLLLIIQTFR